jgi:hypothetical protein
MSRPTISEPEAWLAVRRDHDGNLDVLRLPDGTGFAWELTEAEADAVIAQVQRSPQGAWTVVLEDELSQGNAGRVPQGERHPRLTRAAGRTTGVHSR